VLTAYVDESGQEQDNWMFLAGFYGNDDAWKRVAKEWPKTLGPQRKRLHMSDLKFKYQSEKRMLARAGAVPQQCGLIPIMGGIRQSDFKDILIGTPEEKVLSGYIYCLWAMLFDTLRGLPQGERIEVVFEEQHRYQEFAHIALNAYVDHPEPTDLLSDGTHKLANWRWVPKDSTALLEPADYLAFALSKAWREPGSVRDQWCRPIFKTNDGVASGAVMRPEQIREAVRTGLIDRIIQQAKRQLGGPR
jgi:hypothetical protein